MSESTVCPVNINAAGRRRRLVMGIVALAATLAAHFVLHPTHLWTLFVVAGLFYGWLCALQALTGT